MKLIDLIHAANPEEVSRLYTEQYCQYKEDGWNKVESFIEFRDLMDTLDDLDTEGMSFLLRHVIQDWNDGHAPDDYIDVGLRDNEGKTWAPGSTPWGSYKNMEVIDETEKNLSIDEITTHVYYEITWYGWPANAKKFFEDLQEQVDNLDLDKCIPLDDFLDEFERKLESKDKDQDNG